MPTIPRVLPVVFAFAALFISLDATALEREYEIKTPSSRFPTFKVLETPQGKSWQVYKSDGADFVSLFYLGLPEAKKLLSISDRALASYEEIRAAGGCQNNVVKSGPLGGLDRGSGMDFQVICSNGNTQVEITMHDEYVVNFLTTRVEAAQLKSIALQLIKTLES